MLLAGVDPELLLLATEAEAEAEAEAASEEAASLNEDDEALVVLPELRHVDDAPPDGVASNEGLGALFGGIVDVDKSISLPLRLVVVAVAVVVGKGSVRHELDAIDRSALTPLRTTERLSRWEKKVGEEQSAECRDLATDSLSLSSSHDPVCGWAHGAAVGEGPPGPFQNAGLARFAISRRSGSIPRRGRMPAAPTAMEYVSDVSAAAGDDASRPSYFELAAQRAFSPQPSSSSGALTCRRG